MSGPDRPAARCRAAQSRKGADYWPMAVTRELDDLILRLRTNELELGTWVLRVAGEPDVVRAYDRQLRGLADDWYVNEVRPLPQADPQATRCHQPQPVRGNRAGQCYAGLLLELALAGDRQYMLDGVYEDGDPDAAPRRST